MRISKQLSEAMGVDFENRIQTFLRAQQIIQPDDLLTSPRFLTRSIVPHVQRLSALFNRIETTSDNPTTPDGKYWKDTSNPKNSRLAYFLSFMPCNLFRVAAVLEELGRWGFCFPDTAGAFRAIEWGAGPASGCAGVLAASRFSPDAPRLPQVGNWALIERDLATLKLGQAWLEDFSNWTEGPAWEVRTFHRTVDWDQPLLAKTAPRFHLWLMSYFLNESHASPEIIADRLYQAWNLHLEDDGLVILVEPALRQESRRLLEIRKHLIELFEKKPESGYQILTPCLGHQRCGALDNDLRDQDWCHEEASWWRPPYLRKLDTQTGLDHKSLAFSYLVITRSQKTRSQILPGLTGSTSVHRLVSSARALGKGYEFFVCGTDGKKRVTTSTGKISYERGDCLKNAVFRGEKTSSRLESAQPWPV